MWVASSLHQSQLPTSSFRVGNSEVTPVSHVRDLGIYLDRDTSMNTHISMTVSTCFGALRILRTILHSIPEDMVLSLVTSLVLSRLDYGNATLYGLPSCQLDRYQAVLNAAARMIYGARGRDHVTPLLLKLHWLRPRERIAFKVGCLTWRCLHGMGPQYLQQDIHKVSDSGRRGGLRSAQSLDLIPPRTKNVTHGDRAWAAAAAKVWNSLYDEKDDDAVDFRSEDNYLNFRRLLKQHLWSISYPPN